MAVCPDVAEQESHDPAIDFRHLRRLRVATQVVADALLPDVGSVDARDPLVDLADRLDVELGDGADLHLGHCGEYAASAAPLFRGDVG